MQNVDYKIVFMGTPKFGAMILDGLIKANYKPVLVVTAPDKPTGRKQIITPPPVKLLAESYKIPVVQPTKVENCKLEIENCEPQLVVVAAYGQILPKEVLGIPKCGCLNVHPSLLPKYRGPSPIQYAILNGDEETGVSIVLMDEKLDCGPIVAQEKTTVGSNETAGQLLDRLTVLGAELLIDAIPDWLGGKIKLRQQDEKIASYAKILTREDAEIDWKKPAKEIERKIRALNPWPGTYTFLEKELIKIKDLKKKIKEKQRIRIKILKARLEKNKLIIEEVQLEGKKPVSFKDFLLGHPNFKKIC